jgi:hypothetical protein
MLYTNLHNNRPITNKKVTLIKETSNQFVGMRVGSETVFSPRPQPPTSAMEVCITNDRLRAVEHTRLKGADRFSEQLKSAGSRTIPRPPHKFSSSAAFSGSHAGRADGLCNALHIRTRPRDETDLL